MIQCSVLNAEQCQVFYALYSNDKLFMKTSSSLVPLALEVEKTSKCHTT